MLCDLQESDYPEINNKYQGIRPEWTGSGDHWCIIVGLCKPSGISLVYLGNVRENDQLARLTREGINLEAFAPHLQANKKKKGLNMLKQWSDDNHEWEFHETIGESVRVEVENVAV